MKILNEYPLYRLLIPMILGIIAASIIQAASVSLGLIIFLFLLFSFWIFRHHQFRQYTWRFISGLFITVLFFLFGYQLLSIKTDVNSSQHYSNIDSVTHLLVSINSPLVEKKNSYKTVGSVLLVYLSNNDTATITAKGKILLYFSKTNPPNLKYGDELIIVNKLQIVKNYGNPNEFDYATYLKQQNIHHQVFLSDKDWIKTAHNSANKIIQLSLNIRDVLLQILIDFDFTDDEFAVASAILLGYDEYLDQDLRQLYAGSGAMHILCVSGLHVGIIFLMFNTILAFIKKYKYGAVIHAIIMILIIWLYALVTGLSPSVFRAATMFSFITVGIMINRKTSTYNSLAASAFVLLIYNPYLLFHIGFQLSYMAVLSILFIQPHLAKLFDHKWWIIKKSRDLIAVSIAAQLGTFPLAIYYFHQFPNYFILTNLLVIPMSFIILISGFANIFVYLIGSASSYLGIILTKGLYAGLWFLNSALSLINQLPAAVSKDLYFTISDTFLVYLIILFSALALINRKTIFMIYSLASFILLFGTNALERFRSNQQNQLVIYNIPNHSLIDIISRNTSYFFADSLLLSDTNTIHRFQRDNYLKQRVKYRHSHPIEVLKLIEYQPFSGINNFLVFGDKKIFIIDNSCLLPQDYHDEKIDYILLRNNPKISIFDVIKEIRFDTLIMDASNKYWNTLKWKKQCDSLQIGYWDIKENGAFIISLE